MPKPFPQTRVPAHYRDPNYTTGRPTDYRPEYCQLVVEEMRKHGISLAAFAGVVGVARETVYEWTRRHPEFSDAVSRARAAQQLFWEMKIAHSRKGAETAAGIFALTNIAPEQWRQVRNVQHEHTLKAEQLTDAQLHAIASQKVTAEGNVIDGEVVRSETR